MYGGKGKNNDLRIAIPDGTYCFEFSNNVYLKGNCSYFDSAKDIKEKYLKEAKNKYNDDKIYIVSSIINTLD